MTGQVGHSSISRRRRVAVLGSTGSIGVNTLDVAAALPDRLEIVGLCARSRWNELAEQCRRFRPRIAILTDQEAFTAADRAAFPRETELLCGEKAVSDLASSSDVDTVVAAVVGAAGLMGIWAALEAGKTIALANKEALVVAGALVMEAAARHGSVILPVDSEHSAIFQALAGSEESRVKKIVLTGSGGPFRGKTVKELEEATVDSALKHPTWRMGPKITIDSATLMNKALEVIEARWLFDVSPERIEIVIHPESIIHSLVEFVDGSILAQLSPPDMRLPIQYALTHPERVSGPARRFDWTSVHSFRFEPPDRETFPALDLGYESARRGGTCGAVLNAANETAAAEFLAGEIGFLDIARCCRAVFDQHDYEAAPNLDGLLAADRRARQEAVRWIRTRPRTTRS